MTIRSSLLRGVAFGALLAVGASVAVQAETVDHHHKKEVRRVVRRHEARASATGVEIRELRDEVHALQARLDAQSAAQTQNQQQIQQAAAAAQAAQDQVQTAQAQAAQEQAQIDTIPAQVATAVNAVKPKTDGFYYKGIKITPGGFLEAASIYRSRNIAADIASPFNAIPFASTKAGHEDELKISEHQTRLSGLVQGNVTPDIVLSMYGEFDFQGGAQTANYNESDGFVLRTRHLYGAVDWNDTGWHLLAGQNWSLATLNSKGITPRNELTPPQIDGQYVPGFVWTRQPQFRVTKDLFDKTVWLAASVENPQTTFSGTVPAGVTNNIANGAGIFNGDTGTLTTTTTNGVVTAVSGVATATQSLNHLPDVVVKAAYEAPIYGRVVHVEGFGIGRAFSDRIGTQENNVYTGGVGAGIVVQAVPGLLDLQGSGLTGKGIGRYGTSQLPDVTFRADGRIEPIQETEFLAGATLHATKMLDVYVFAGEEHENRKTFPGGFGYGSYTANNAGCLTEGGTCGATTKLVEQLTAGFWQKIYQGPYGRLQVGVQYSYTQRDAFAGLNGIAPIANDNMIFTSFRYYPF